MNFAQQDRTGFEMNNYTMSIEEALVRFFSKCNCIVGHEANYQVMLAFELEQDFPGRVRREFRTESTGRGGIDIAVLDSKGQPWAVIEIKGGAYNNRSSLKDEYRKGIPKDINTLAQVDVEPSRRWIVAIDALKEFGRSLPMKKQQVIKEDANSRDISFAYYGHGERTCVIAAAGNRVRYPDVPDRIRLGRQGDASEVFSMPELQRVFADARDSLEREADVVSAAYQWLLSLGYSVDQVATETYFGFAPRKNGKRMQERPDLCLFNPQVDGHFNLYPKGDTSRTYDALKLANRRVMAEFKGGVVHNTKRDSELMELYGEDITKLSKWRRVAESQNYPRDPKLPPVDFVFIAVDLRNHCLDPGLYNELSTQAKRGGLRFVYVHLPEVDRSTRHAA